MGSNFQRGMQAATAVLQGLAGGDITQAAAGAASPYLAQLVKQQTDDGPSRVMAHALVQGALVAAQNKSAMVGATGAATGELVGMMATELYHKKASQLTEGEKETVSTLATFSAGLASGLAVDSSTEALAGAQTGKTVVENNALSDLGSLISPQTQQDAYLVSYLASQGKSQEEITQALVLSHQDPSWGTEYKINANGKTQVAAGMGVVDYAEISFNNKELSMDTDVTFGVGMQAGATIGIDLGPYFPGIIGDPDRDYSFSLGYGLGSFGLSGGKDGLMISFGVGPSIGIGGIKTKTPIGPLDLNGSLSKEVYKYDF